MFGLSQAVSTALAGISRAQETALAASSRIASGESDDLASDIFALRSARTTQAAGLLFIKTVDNMERDVLDILA